MKQWEAKALGFSAPWWLLIQTFIDGPAHDARIGLGIVSVCVGTLAALFAAVSEVGVGEVGIGRTIAHWFLLGITSIFVMPLIAITLWIVLSLGASLLSL